jgi:beta-phosphoglucomutase-like phosphatase (HAD superfamily)
MTPRNFEFGVYAAGDETMASVSRCFTGGAMPYSGYIFDVEGTLVDSVPQDLLSFQESLAGSGIVVPYELLQLYSGLDGDQTLQLLAPDLNAEQRSTVLDARCKIYEAKYLRSVKAFAGVRAVFEVLARRGGRIALATDCKGPELKRYCSLMNVDDLIDCVACGDDVDHGKPDARLVGRALRKLGVSPRGRYDWRHSVRRGSRAGRERFRCRRPHGRLLQRSLNGRGLHCRCKRTAGPPAVP